MLVTLVALLELLSKDELALRFRLIIQAAPIGFTLTRSASLLCCQQGWIGDGEVVLVKCFTQALTRLWAIEALTRLLVKLLHASGAGVAQAQGRLAVLVAVFVAWSLDIKKLMLRRWWKRRGEVG